MTAEEKGYRKLLRMVAPVLAMYPPARELYGSLVKRPSQKEARACFHNHKPVWRSGSYQCLACLEYIGPCTPQRCKALPECTVDVLHCALHLTHKLRVGWTVGTKVLVLFCWQCGGYTTGQHSHKLRRLCLAQPFSERRKLGNGKLPHTNERFCSVYAICSLTHHVFAFAGRRMCGHQI